VHVSTSASLWALAAMVGCAVYFVLLRAQLGLPPVALAGSGMLLGAAVLGSWARHRPARDARNTTPVHFRDVTVPFWVPLLLVGIVATAIAYLRHPRLAPARLAPRLVRGAARGVAALVTAWFCSVRPRS
jgi:drug/metabolite transporter (DMT)-like permease